MPPHPTAAATAAAIRLRHQRPVTDPDLREDAVSDVIGDALSPAFSQLEVPQTTLGSPASPRRPIAARSKRPYPAAISDLQQKPTNKAETRCHPHGPLPSTGSGCFCW